MPKATLKTMSSSNKVSLLSTIAQDSDFINYIDAVVEYEAFHRSLLQTSKNYDPVKFNNAPKATSESEIVAKLQAAGVENPTQLIDKMKSVTEKWIYVSKKYPDFTRSFTDEEKKVFFRKHIDNALDRKNGE